MSLSLFTCCHFISNFLLNSIYMSLNADSKLSMFIVFLCNVALINKRILRKPSAVGPGESARWCKAIMSLWLKLSLCYCGY